MRIWGKRRVSAKSEIRNPKSEIDPIHA